MVVVSAEDMAVVVLISSTDVVVSADVITVVEKSVDVVSGTVEEGISVEVKRTSVEDDSAVEIALVAAKTSVVEADEDFGLQGLACPPLQRARTVNVIETTETFILNAKER